MAELKAGRQYQVKLLGPQATPELLGQRFQSAVITLNSHPFFRVLDARQTPTGGVLTVEIIRTGSPILPFVLATLMASAIGGTFWVVDDLVDGGSGDGSGLGFWTVVGLGLVLVGGVAIGSRFL